ncbi:MAG: 2-oxo acid dehydrogenase subunit E2 [Saprospiraceae bacterium]|nr:2-oxo acid dehydrogenase subunit E2 [Saprospiraceae bacterium]
MASPSKRFERLPFPQMRRPSIDAGRLSRNRHIVHGLLELDVTPVVQWIDRHEEETGEKYSFTAYIIYCLGQAIAKHSQLHAYLNWRRQLVVFEDVNVVTMVEVPLDGIKVPVPHLLKGVNHSNLREIHAEIRKAQHDPQSVMVVGKLRSFYRLPGVMRRFLSRMVLRLPTWFRKYSSSVLVTSLGMFGRQAGWGIPRSTFTLTVTLGGISKKPWLVDDQITARDILHLTLSIDHDVVDGAPAARFSQDLAQLIQHLPEDDHLLEKAMTSSVAR